MHCMGGALHSTAAAHAGCAYASACTPAGLKPFPHAAAALLDPRPRCQHLHSPCRGLRRKALSTLRSSWALLPKAPSHRGNRDSGLRRLAVRERSRHARCQAEVYTMASASHAAEWRVPPEQDGWVLSHDALRLDLADLQRLLDALAAQAAAGRPLQRAQVEAAAAAWRYFEHMLGVHHDTEEELYFPLLRTRFEVPQKQSADHRRILGLMQECDAKITAVQGVRAAADAAVQMEALRASFSQLRQLCEQHFREEEAETLPLIRAHFAPAEVTPTAKKIAKAYALLDMGNYLRPMTPAQRTAWMSRVGMPFFIQWLMLLQVWRYERTTGLGARKRRVTSPPGRSAALRAAAAGLAGCCWWVPPCSASCCVRSSSRRPAAEASQPQRALRAASMVWPRSHSLKLQAGGLGVGSEWVGGWGQD
ncbi:hypothetical protein ABPG75_011528 [Micractinium tetrahymenae]